MNVRLAKKRTLIEQIRLISEHDRVTDELNNYIRKQIESTFGRLSNRVSTITVMLRDVNGPRGGIDTRCQIHLRLLPKGQIVVSADSANEFAAASTAIARAERALMRHLGRRRSRKHRLDSRRGALLIETFG